MGLHSYVVHIHFSDDLHPDSSVSTGIAPALRSPDKEMVTLADASWAWHRINPELLGKIHQQARIIRVEAIINRNARLFDEVTIQNKYLFFSIGEAIWSA
jgi:hypothetical protein